MRAIEAYQKVTGTPGADVVEVSRQLLEFSSDLASGGLRVESAAAAVGVLRAVQPSAEALLRSSAAVAVEAADSLALSPKRCRFHSTRGRRFCGSQDANIDEVAYLDEFEVRCSIHLLHSGEDSPVGS